MQDLALKIRLAVLWLFVAVTMSVNTTLYLVVPGVIDEIRAGEVGGHAGRTRAVACDGGYVLLGSVGYGCSVPNFEG